MSSNAADALRWYVFYMGGFIEGVFVVLLAEARFRMRPYSALAATLKLAGVMFLIFYVQAEMISNMGNPFQWRSVLAAAAVTMYLSALLCAWWYSHKAKSSQEGKENG